MTLTSPYTHKEALKVPPYLIYETIGETPVYYKAIGKLWLAQKQWKKLWAMRKYKPFWLI